MIAASWYTDERICWTKNQGMCCYSSIFPPTHSLAIVPTLCESSCHPCFIIVVAVSFPDEWNFSCVAHAQLNTTSNGVAVSTWSFRVVQPSGLIALATVRHVEEYNPALARKTWIPEVFAQEQRSICQNGSSSLEPESGKRTTSMPDDLPHTVEVRTIADDCIQDNVNGCAQILLTVLYVR